MRNFPGHPGGSAKLPEKRSEKLSLRGLLVLVCRRLCQFFLGRWIFFLAFFFNQCYFSKNVRSSRVIHKASPKANLHILTRFLNRENSPPELVSFQDHCGFLIAVSAAAIPAITKMPKRPRGYPHLLTPIEETT